MNIRQETAKMLRQLRKWKREYIYVDVPKRSDNQTTVQLLCDNGVDFDQTSISDMASADEVLRIVQYYYDRHGPDALLLFSEHHDYDTNTGYIIISAHRTLTENDTEYFYRVKERHSYYLPMCDKQMQIKQLEERLAKLKGETH